MKRSEDFPRVDLAQKTTIPLFYVIYLEH